MTRWIRILLPTALGTLIGACSVMGGTPSAPAAATSASSPVASAASTSDQATKALQEVTDARQAARTLLTAGKITVSQFNAAQATLDAIRSEIKTAQSTIPLNSAQAAALLATALKDLSNYEQGTSK